MTKGEAVALETDRNIFQIKFGQEKEEITAMSDVTEQIKAEEDASKINIKLRFARLKKSLRKRSASIL